jgi:Protein of unknown function (DUF3140)
VDDDEKRGVADEFAELVNMTRRQLSEWLETDESKSVGQSDDGEESVGHESGRRIVAILDKHKADLTDDDFEHMRRVNAYNKRHLAQGGPQDDVEHSRWRYSLMNWGHDPLK